MTNFLAFFLQALFARNIKDLYQIFSSFLLLILVMNLSVLSYAVILFTLLKVEVTETKLLYKKFKIELLFYMFNLLYLIIIDFNSFLNLNFHNFGLLHLVNIFEILILVFVLVAHFYYSILKEPLKIKKVKLLPLNERLNFILPNLIFLFFSLVLFLLKNQISKFLISYK
jgi:hypothetical protein